MEVILPLSLEMFSRSLQIWMRSEILRCKNPSAAS
jgi:hypothetical protein